MPRKNVAYHKAPTSNGRDLIIRASVAMRSELWKKLTYTAQRRGISRSWLISQIIEQYYDETKGVNL